MKERKLTIMGVYVARIKGSCSKVIHNNYNFIGRGREDGRHGVAFILHPNIAAFVEEINQINERILGISIKFKNSNISIIQVYAPQLEGQ